FVMDKIELYKFEVANSAYAMLIKAMLRMYGGIIDHYTKISETQLAKQLKMEEKDVVEQLNYLHKNKILIYIASNDKPTVTLLTERMHERNLYINTQYINQRRKVITDQIQAMLEFVTQKKQCRQVFICNYFDEKEISKCGRCDICLEEKKKLEFSEDFKMAKEDILQKTNNTWISIEDILPKNAHFAKQLYKDVIRFMLDEKMLMANEKNEIKKYRND
nr:RecQ family zinc-binding domain-containing protein [Chitinophagales bacterium]